MSEDLQQLMILVRNSYGSADGIFAGHSTEQKFAAQSIVEANKQNASFSEFLQFHKDYLSTRGFSKEHIKEQIKRIKKVPLYFVYSD